MKAAEIIGLTLVFCRAGRVLGVKVHAADRVSHEGRGMIWMLVALVRMLAGAHGGHDPREKAAEKESLKLREG
jgi:hypothetical protein